MVLRKITYIFLSGILFLSLACAKLPEKKAPSIENGNLVVDTLPDASSIPSEWGALISVCPIGEYATLAQLWFQDENGTIRIVPYNVTTNKFSPKIVVIPRK